MQSKQEPPSLLALFLSYVVGCALLSWLLNYVFYGRMQIRFYLLCGAGFAALMTCIEWYRRNSR